MAVHDRGHDARTYLRSARPACRLGIYEIAGRSLVKTLSGIGMSGIAPFGKYALILLAAFIVLGVLSGALGSAVSITKYLKEKEFAIVDEE